MATNLAIDDKLLVLKEQYPKPIAPIGSGEVKPHQFGFGFGYVIFGFWSGKMGRSPVHNQPLSGPNPKKIKLP